MSNRRYHLSYRLPDLKAQLSSLWFESSCVRPSTREIRLQSLVRHGAAIAARVQRQEHSTLGASAQRWDGRSTLDYDHHEPCGRARRRGGHTVPSVVGGGEWALIVAYRCFCRY
jgi:hypothetical protein